MSNFKQAICLLEEGIELAVPAFISFLAGFRSDLAVYKNLSFEDRLCLLFWWQCYGSHVYTDIEWDLDEASEVIGYIRSLSAEELFQQYPKLILAWLRFPTDSSILISNKKALADLLLCRKINESPLLFKFIFDSRPDLKSLGFESFREKCDFFQWWANNGRCEYPRFKKFGLNGELVDCIFDDENANENKYSLVRLLYFSRSDLRLDYPCFEDSFSELLNWFDNYGKFEYPRILDKFNIIKKLYSEREDLQTLYPSFEKYFFELINWYDNYGKNEYSFLFNKTANQSLESSGVNIVGFHTGVLGLGEDVRLASQVVLDYGFKVAAISAPISGPDDVVAKVEGCIDTDTKLFDISLFCLPPPELYRLGIEGGDELLDGCDYKIAFSPWELPTIPKELEIVTSSIDEVWAQSDYVKKCFDKIDGLKVYKMPMVVEIPEPSNGDSLMNIRRNKSTFTYLVMFDGSSWLSRKNPLLAVRAYVNAYKESEYNVQLIIKTMNLDCSHPMWTEIVDLTRERGDILIIDQRYSRQQTIDLIHACDCYISLHRSEGFGRIIAESMLLDTAVIVSGYSGNMDFCNNENSYLVSGELLPLSEGDYIFDVGQFWFDADLDSAVNQIREVFRNSDLRNARKDNAREFIRNNYSYSNALKFYTSRIGEISNRKECK